LIISRTPFRVSLFGGGADYPAWYRKYGGKVLGTSIDKYCYISARYLPGFFDHKYRIVYSKVENTRTIAEIRHPAVREVLKGMQFEAGVEIHHDGDLPAKSGLGSSSAFTVGLIHALTALTQKTISKKDLAKEAIYYERNVLKENVGSQDQVLTAYGGLNVVQFKEDDSFDVSPLILPRKRLRELRDHMMLFFTGFQRIASKIAKNHIENLEPRRRDIQIMQQMVDEAIELLQHGTMEEFGRLLDENWEFKKKSTKERVTTPDIETIYRTARRAGAWGGKILGAGGGGFMLVFAEPGHHNRIRKRLKALTHVPFKFETAGSKIVVYEPEGGV